MAQQIAVSYGSTRVMDFDLTMAISAHVYWTVGYEGSICGHVLDLESWKTCPP